MRVLLAYGTVRVDSGWSIKLGLGAQTLGIGHDTWGKLDKEGVTK